MSSTSQIAQTGVQYRLLPATPGTHFSPLYYEASQAGQRLGSVNAGNSVSFFVGGGGINAAFARLLPGNMQYQSIHEALYSSIASGYATKTNFPVGSPLQFLLLNKPKPNGLFNNGEGSVFVDVFSASGLPHGNPDNFAMVYVCGPDGTNGYASKSDFLTAVTETARNSIETVKQYNSQEAPASGLHSIESVRFCLFSGSIYRYPTSTTMEVADAIYVGISAGLKPSPGGINSIEFENASGDWSGVVGQ